MINKFNIYHLRSRAKKHNIRSKVENSEGTKPVVMILNGRTKLFEDYTLKCFPYISIKNNIFLH